MRRPGSMTPTYSVVVPVYGNDETIPALLERLDRARRRARRADRGRVRRRRLARRLAARSCGACCPSAPFATQLIAHSRNFGSFAAIRTGLAAAARRLRRRHGRRPAGAARAGARPSSSTWRPASTTSPSAPATARRPGRVAAVARVLVDVPTLGAPRRSRRRRRHLRLHAAGRRELVQLDESHSSLVGLLYWLGFRRIEVPYARSPRPAGRERVVVAPQAALPPRQRLLVHRRARHACSS